MVVGKNVSGPARSQKGELICDRRRKIRDVREGDGRSHHNHLALFRPVISLSSRHASLGVLNVVGHDAVQFCSLMSGELTSRPRSFHCTDNVGTYKRWLLARLLSRQDQRSSQQQEINCFLVFQGPGFFPEFPS